MEEIDTLLPNQANRILSSTQLGERSSVSGGRPRRRLRRVDLDDSDDDDNVDMRHRLNSTINAMASAAPFPGLESIAYSPIRREDDDSDADDLAERSLDAEEEEEVGGDGEVKGGRRKAEAGGDEDNEGEEDLDVETLRQLKGVSEGVRKKVVRRPLPKLDPPTYVPHCNT